MARDTFLRTIVLLGVAALAATGTSLAQVLPGECGPTLQPPYDSVYTLDDLGPVPGVPMPYGGLAILPDDPNVLIIGGNSNQAGGKLYAIDLVRDSNGHIEGFSGNARFYAEAPYNDGGVVFGPGDVLFLAEWPANNLSQLKPGSTTADKVINLDPLGVVNSIAGLNFPPLPGLEMTMKAVTWSTGDWYTVTLSKDMQGTFDITSVTHEMILTGGPEQFVYVQGASPEFPGSSIVVAEWSASTVSVYDHDANGDPVRATRHEFITDFCGVEGVFIDPVTGDFLFSTWGLFEDRVVVVSAGTCLGDLDGNGVVDISDLLIVLAEWGPCADPNDCPADLDGNGTVDVTDLLLLLANWGPCDEIPLDICDPNYVPKPGDPTPELYCDSRYRENVLNRYMSAWVIQDLLTWFVAELGHPELASEIHADTYVETSRSFGGLGGGAAGAGPLTMKVFLEPSGKSLLVQIHPDDYHMTHHPNIPPLPTVQVFFDDGTGEALEFVFDGIMEILGMFSEHIAFLGEAYQVALGLQNASNPCTLWCALHHLSETPQSAGEWPFCVPECVSFVDTVLSPLTFSNAGHAANIMRMMFYYECINLCAELWSPGYFSSNELHFMRSAIRFVRDSIPCQNPGCG